jgi:hypothetical protein
MVRPGVGMAHLREVGAVVDTNSGSATLEQLKKPWPGPSKSWLTHAVLNKKEGNHSRF